MKFKTASIALIFALSVPFVQAAETAPYVYRDGGVECHYFTTPALNDSPPGNELSKALE